MRILVFSHCRLQEPGTGRMPHLLRPHLISQAIKEESNAVATVFLGDCATTFTAGKVLIDSVPEGAPPCLLVRGSMDKAESIDGVPLYRDIIVNGNRGRMMFRSGAFKAVRNFPCIIQQGEKAQVVQRDGGVTITIPPMSDGYYAVISETPDGCHVAVKRAGGVEQTITAAYPGYGWSQERVSKMLRYFNRRWDKAIWSAFYSEDEEDNVHYKWADTWRHATHTLEDYLATLPGEDDSSYAALAAAFVSWRPKDSPVA
jgi:hypothetical protein